jgi:hypothetical protein
MYQATLVRRLSRGDDLLVRDVFVEYRFEPSGNEKPKDLLVAASECPSPDEFREICLGQLRVDRRTHFLAIVEGRGALF